MNVEPLNGLEVLGTDVKNALLTVPVIVKVCIRKVPKFGKDQWKLIIVLR